MGTEEQLKLVVEALEIASNYLTDEQFTALMAACGVHCEMIVHVTRTEGKDEQA